MFRYYHNVDLLHLREAGVRTFREIEEMIEGPYSFSEILFEKTPERIYQYTGFTRESKPLEVIIEETRDADLITHFVRKPTVEEIIRNFCRHCHSKRRNT